jgi:hypothetical protein
VGLHDFGYWSLRDEGFKPMRLEDWENEQDRIEEHVLALVGQIRHGIFAVSPRKSDCTQHCDYNAVCRIGQTRTVGKSLADAPELELNLCTPRPTKSPPAR